MLNLKTFRCSSCNTVLFNLPEAEIAKINGRTFYCECCGQHNILIDSKLDKAGSQNPNIFSLGMEAI